MRLSLPPEQIIFVLEPVRLALFKMFYQVLALCKNLFVAFRFPSFAMYIHLFNVKTVTFN